VTVKYAFFNFSCRHPTAIPLQPLPHYSTGLPLFPSPGLWQTKPLGLGCVWIYGSKTKVNLKYNFYKYNQAFNKILILTFKITIYHLNYTLKKNSAYLQFKNT
jgi:hypothetical protein